MERVSKVLQFPVIIEWGGPFSVEPQFLRNSLFSLEAVPLKELSFRNSLNPGSSSGWSDSFSTNSNFLGCPGASLRFKTISILKVATSISQDAISGSKKDTQF